MSGPATDAPLLQGKAVAFTGKLASMTRAKAAELVRAYGGQWMSSVTRRTSTLVVGQEGWPLRKDGRLSRKLQVARKLHPMQSIEVITEAELLARLGLESETPFHRLSTAQLSQLLKIPGERVRAWVQLGLIRPTETLRGVHYFDFRQASWAKSLCTFARAGISPARIRKSLEQVRHWVPEVDEPLDQLSVLEQNGHLLVRLGDGMLLEPTGQGLLDFDDGIDSGPIQVDRETRTAEEWFEIGCENEDLGRLNEAARAYRNALTSGGPNRDAVFNLANVLYALGRKEQAAERLRQATEIDRDFVDAWNNLGSVLTELGEHEEAKQAFETALEISPECSDALYNLADLLDETGQQRQAREHWQAYLRHDAISPWANHARRCLGMAQT